MHAQAVGNQITVGHNQALPVFLSEFASEHLEASVITFDFADFLVGLSNNATALGFTDTTTPCYTGAVAGTSTASANTSAVCSNPDAHTFWDGVHPTGHVHQLWGQALSAQIRPIFTPTTSTAASPAGRKLLKKVPRVAMTNVVTYGQAL